MSGDSKPPGEAASQAPDLQAGGAAEGWASHSGHLEPEDFSQETAQVPSQPPTPSGEAWNTLPPGTYTPTTVVPQAGRSAMLPWVVIGALLILVLILVGALNSRDYHLVQRGQEVEVRRGGWLPGTTRTMAPESAILLRRYAPVRLEVGMQFRPRRFTEREDLDAGLVNLVVELLSPAIARADEDRVEQLGARLELFPSAQVVLEGRHKDLLGKVGLIRGRRAEADALDAVSRARDLYQRYHRHAGREGHRAIERLDAVQRLLSGAKIEPSVNAPGNRANEAPKTGSEF